MSHQRIDLFPIPTDNRFFVYALVCSFLIHSAVLIMLVTSRSKSRLKSMKQLEVFYQQVRPRPVPIAARGDKQVDLLKNTDTPQSVKIASRPLDKSFTNIKDIFRIKSAPVWDKKAIPSMKIGEFEKRIVIPMPQSEKISDAKYMQYQNMIRSKIHIVADRYADTLDLENGEVYVSFILTADGMLRESKILNYRSSADEKQKELSLRFIREANPFPSFPKEYHDFPELPFNITISFQVKKLN